jgi:hypothetical protein
MGVYGTAVVRALLLRLRKKGSGNIGFTLFTLESILGAISLLILLPLKEQYHDSMKRLSSFQNLLTLYNFQNCIW